MKYTIRHIHAGSSMRLGATVGAILALIPAILLGWAIQTTVHGLRAWLASWASFQIPLLDSEISLLQLTNLTSFLEFLQRLDEQRPLLTFIVIFAGLIIGMVWGALTSLQTATIYNLAAKMGGALVVTADTQHDSMDIQQNMSPSLPGTWLMNSSNPQQRWSLASSPIQIGSAPQNQIVLPQLSPHHIEIRYEDGRYILYDLSGGQTWVNNHPCQGPHMLRSGFRIRLGTKEFVFQNG